MSSPHFDTLTRSLATSSSRRDALKLLGGSIAAGALVLWGKGTPASASATAQAYATAPAYAAAAGGFQFSDAENCISVLGDGTCPSGYTKKPRPGNVPQFNGCGGQGDDFVPPQGFGKASFTSSCNTHDVCYENCGATQADCDNDFLGGMVHACETAYPGLANTLKRYACIDLAGAFYAAVRLKGGEFYAAGQNKACQCCKAKYYCACNGACYNSSAVCLSECEVSLGCFTGICGPAEAGQCS